MRILAIPWIEIVDPCHILGQIVHPRPTLIVMEDHPRSSGGAPGWSDREYQERGTREYQGRGTREYQNRGTREYQERGTREYQDRGTREYQDRGTREYPNRGTRE